MREWNYRDDKVVTVASVDYFWTLTRSGVVVREGVRTSALELRSLRAFWSGLAGDGYTFSWEREVRWVELKACYWCQARPRQWDYDCDGPYMLSTCETEQCNAGYEWACANGYERYPFGG